MTEKKAEIAKHRRSSKWMLLLDKIAHHVITIGGIGTIAAVLMVFFFLVWVVGPMFMPADTQAVSTAAVDYKEIPRFIGMDDDQSLIWSISDSGTLQIFDAKSGEYVHGQNLFGENKPTAITVSTIHNIIVAGFADGTIRIGKIEFINSFFDKEQIESDYHEMAVGEFKRRGLGVVFKTPSRLWRQTTLTVTVDEPLSVGGSNQINKIDLTMSTSGPVIATYDDQNKIAIHKVVEKVNFMTMQKTKKLESRNLPFVYSDKLGTPLQIVLVGQGEYVLLVWENAYSERFNLLDDEAYLAEQSKLTRIGDQARGDVTAVGRFLGRNTLLLGYENGDVSAWFLSEPKDAETKDSRVWQEGHLFNGSGSAIRNIASSRRQRLALFTYANNTARMVHVTSERVLYDDIGVEESLGAAIAPKDDGFVLLGADKMNLTRLDAKHPDVTFSSLFFPVWYEGYEGPETVWQSSSASDDAEPKLGLWPLVFGTLKGTFYSLLFGVPVALAAAIYSSEFMAPRTKRTVKPIIEMMASLPSVVLGFLGGIIISVWMKDYVVTVLSAFFILPLCVGAAAYLMQLLPRQVKTKLNRQRLWIIAVPCFAIGWLISSGVGYMAENALFAGNFIAWLDGEGDAFGGIFYLCLPISICFVMYALARWIKPWLIDKNRGGSVATCAMVDLVKFVIAIAATVVIAALLAGFIVLCGFESRGPNNLFNIYETRNALVVGFMMAFAIIPIIYTIADDALSSVPSHLRAASLGAGATPWQTAMRVVVPTAMSGLFSAIMVGLGRAIGETMIMLMVAGNTPTKSWNMFSGFKTLSANIASELPESVVDSTHYRTLFLSALVLFIMTFVLNTFAEYIRTQFRKKAVSL